MSLCAPRSWHCRSPRLLETLHSALCIHVLYDYFVTHYGNPAEGISKIVWYVAVITAIGCDRPLTELQECTGESTSVYRWPCELTGSNGQLTVILEVREDTASGYS